MRRSAMELGNAVFRTLHSCRTCEAEQPLLTAHIKAVRKYAVVGDRFWAKVLPLTGEPMTIDGFWGKEGFFLFFEGMPTGR